MRVLIINPTLGEAYGQEKILQDTCELLRRDGHKVYLLGEFIVGALPTCDGYAVIPNISQLHWLSARSAIYETRSLLKGYLKYVQPDVIHLFDQLDFRLLKDINRFAPTLFSSHTLSSTCPSSTRYLPKQGACPRPSGWSCLNQNRRSGCLNSYPNLIHRLHAILNFRLRQRALKEFPTITAVSPYVQNLLLLEGFSAAQLQLLPNPVSLNVPVRTERNTVAQFVISARLTEHKGVRRVIELFKKIETEPWKLSVFGDGPQRSELEELISKLGLTNRVSLRGKVSNNEMQEHIAQADCLIQPNLGPEPYGLAVAEAIRLGTPVIAHAIPNLTNLVEIKEGSVLVPLGNKSAFIEAIEKAIEKKGMRLPTQKEDSHEQEYLNQLLTVYEACQRRFHSQHQSDSLSLGEIQQAYVKRTAPFTN